MTSPEVVREIMFLLGVEYVATRKYEQCVKMVRSIWHNGYEIGVEMEKERPKLFKKIRSIIHNGRKGG